MKSLSNTCIPLLICWFSFLRFGKCFKLLLYAHHIFFFHMIQQELSLSWHHEIHRTKDVYEQRITKYTLLSTQVTHVGQADNSLFSNSFNCFPFYWNNVPFLGKFTACYWGPRQWSHVPFYNWPKQWCITTNKFGIH